MTLSNSPRQYATVSNVVNPKAHVSTLLRATVAWASLAANALEEMVGTGEGVDVEVIDVGVREGTVVTVAVGVFVDGTMLCNVIVFVVDNQTEIPINTNPIILIVDLALIGARGISISLAFIPPPQMPRKRAATPAIAKTTGTVIIYSSSLY